MVAGQPSLWLLGALGFAARGGFLLLTATIFVLPTPVELRMLLGGNLGSTGFSPAFMDFVGAAVLVLGIIVLVALAVSAYVEMLSFERLARDAETSMQRDGREALQLNGAQRRSLVGQLFVVQLLALLVLALAAVPLMNQAVALAHEEILRPSLGGTIYVRVLSGLRDPLLLLLSALVFVELVSSLATRWMLVSRFGLGPADRSARAGFARRVAEALLAAFLRPLRRPIQTIAVLLLVWLASVAVLVPAGLAVAAGWRAVRSAYLAPGSAGDPQALLGLALVTIALAAVWCAALALAGFASALRASFWSVESLR